LIVENMKKFANDGECLENLKGFKGELQVKMAEYRAAMAITMKSEMNDRVNAQLTSIARFEQQMASQLQETVVRETANAFRDTFPKDTTMQDAVIDSACKSIAGKGSGSDPLKDFFQKSFDEVAKANLATTKGNASGSIVERVAAVQQSRESQFTTSFMVSAAEAAEVKKLGAGALSGDSLDLTKLSEENLAKLEALFTKINNKVGYNFPSDKQLLTQIDKTGDSGSDEFVEYANHQVSIALAKFKAARLGSFVKAFA